MLIFDSSCQPAGTALSVDDWRSNIFGVHFRTSGSLYETTFSATFLFDLLQANKVTVWIMLKPSASRGFASLGISFSGQRSLAKTAGV